MERAAMEDDQRSRDREAEAGAGRRADAAPAEELLEHVPALLVRDARTVIAHGDAEESVLPLGADGDRRPGRRVLDRVADEIAEGLPQPAAVRRHRHRVRRSVEREPLPALLGEDLMIGHDLAE